jgi:hypothetical protein
MFRERGFSLSQQRWAPQRAGQYVKYAHKKTVWAHAEKDPEEVVGEMTTEYLATPFDTFSRRKFTFVTAGNEGLHVGFAVRGSGLIMGFHLANKVVKKAYKKSMSPDQQFGFLDMASLMPQDVRQGVDYWTQNDVASLRAYIILNSQNQMAEEFMGNTPFDSLAHHIPVVRITISPANVKDVTLYPFNYWSLRIIPSTTLENAPLHNPEAFSWITLDQGGKDASVSRI